MKYILSLSSVITLLFFSIFSQAETKKTQPLKDTILAQDQALFEAFNTCYLETFKTYIDEKVEFYQDNDEVTNTRAQLEMSFNDRCQQRQHITLRRELVTESVEVHPIKGFGAVQMGTHHFWVKKQGEAEQLGSYPSFVHLWHHDGSQWKITRVISYGH